MNDADLNAGKVTVNITGGTNTVTGSNTVTGDVKINTAGNLTLTKGSSLEFGAGTLTIDGTHGASGSAQRNGIAGVVENDAPLGEVTLNGTTVNITGGGNIEVDKLNIAGGEINVSGTGADLTVPVGEDWRKGSIISGTTSLDMTGGKVTLGENGQMITYENGSINLSGGEVVLNGGSGTEAILRASNGIDNRRLKSISTALKLPYPVMVLSILSIQPSRPVLSKLPAAVIWLWSLIWEKSKRLMDLQHVLMPYPVC